MSNTTQKTFMQFLKNQDLTMDEAMSCLIHINDLEQRCKRQEEKLKHTRHIHDQFEAQERKINLLESDIEAHRGRYEDLANKTAQMMSMRRVEKLKGQLDALMSLAQGIGEGIDPYGLEEMYP